MSIQTLSQIVYRSTEARRTYLTKRAAIHAEARALLSKKHPPEKAELDVGYNGWRWSVDYPRANVLLRRVVRLVKRSMAGGGGT